MSKPDQGRPSTPPDDPLAVPDTLFNRLDGWTWLGCYGGYYLQADPLHLAGFEHGFFTRRWQGRQPDELACYLSAGTSIHRPQQVHGSEILEASQADGPPWPEADGLVSNRGGQSLWVCGADCTPVLIADPGTGHAAACHAGWRGLAAGILPKAVEKLEALGADRNKLLIALGPAVSGSNYQVGIEVAEAVARSLHVDDSKAEISSAELHDRLCALQSAGALSKSPT
ncbi:MAG TPA: polyphenol oxidase family protein, partial [Prochlorococcaceae cyanobacterium Fu_MAG_50]|nr:polyphenol oxidase family protein [Prochlorococcaceae cyanobacterium Fu_MAG_50]